MKVISGPEPLTDNELGATLWNTEYRGKTIGEWTEVSWRESLLDAPPRLPGNSPSEVLGELGLLVMRTTPYLYIMQLYKLERELPELRPYLATLATWEGVYQHGRPYLKTGERLVQAERLAEAIRNEAARAAPVKRKRKARAKPAPKPMLSLAESSALLAESERLAAATRSAPAAEPPAPAKTRSKAKPAPALAPAESSATPVQSATVIQFPGRR